MRRSTPTTDRPMGNVSRQPEGEDGDQRPTWDGDQPEDRHVVDDEATVED